MSRLFFPSHSCFLFVHSCHSSWGAIARNIHDLLRSRADPCRPYLVPRESEATRSDTQPRQGRKKRSDVVTTATSTTAAATIASPPNSSQFSTFHFVSMGSSYECQPETRNTFAENRPFRINDSNLRSKHAIYSAMRWIRSHNFKHLIKRPTFEGSHPKQAFAPT